MNEENNLERKEPEILTSTQQNNNNQSYTHVTSDGKSFYTFTSFKNSSGFSGSYSGLITLGLTIFCGIQYGLLAAIGFVFFYTLLSIVSYFVMFRIMLSGTIINQYVFRVINWIICVALVAWLS